MPHCGRFLSERRLAAVFACIAALFTVASAPGAVAQSIWRLAGTFNGWNTVDVDWEMTPVQGHTGRFGLERIVPPGEHRFKFVRNGDWGAGHLGDAGDGSLVQPGGDILLDVPALAKLRIELDVNDARWSRVVASIDKPFVVARVLGTPSAGQPFVIDYTQSLTNSGVENAGVRAQLTTRFPDRPGVSCTSNIVVPTDDTDASTVVEQACDFQETAIAFDQSAGQLHIEATRGGTLLDWELGLWEGQSGTMPREGTIGSVTGMLRIYEAHQLSAVAPRTVSFSDFEHQGDGVFRALVSALTPATARVTFALDDRTVMEGEPVDVPRGEHVIQVRDGALVRTSEDGILHAGHWRRFTYTPRDHGQPLPETVHLIGDFNAWAPPTSDRAIPMLPDIDGTYRAIVDLPPGTFEYGFLIDGSRRIADPASDRSVVIAGPTAEELGPAAPGHINGAGVRHTPDLPGDFTAVSDGLGLFDAAITTLSGDVESITLVAFPGTARSEPETIRVPLHQDHTADGFDRWRARAMLDMPRDAPGGVTYRFELKDGDASFTTDWFTAPLEPGIDLPDWAKGAVWYQIFAERFRNGNPLNDPSRPSIFFEEWAADWYSIDNDERTAWHERTGTPLGHPMPERQGGDLYHVVWDRRYGGDLQGVQEKLGYLKDLGVTAIYFNPVFEGDSMHKYDATAYHHIDDNFGTPATAGRVGPVFEYPEGENPADPSTWGWTPADRYFIDEFLPAARAHGIRVVIDGVWNHTGREFWAWQDIIEKGNRSPYADWFYAEYNEQSGALESWRAWDGPDGWLPKFKQTATGDLVPEVKDHIFAVTRRWMDPNNDGDPSDGIDGWRLDVPLDIGLPFWEDWRRLVKSINHDAVIIAEIWSDHEADPVINSGIHFDTHMHYPFAMAFGDWLGIRPGTTSYDLARRLETEAFDDAAEINLIHQNLFASHDTDRWVSQLFNPGRDYDQGNRPQDNGPHYDGSRPTEAHFELSVLGIAIQATYLGAPMIYYADELGAWGADDPTDRKPTPWPELGAMENPDDNHIPGWYERYAEWFTLRRDETLGPILRFGSVRHLDTGRDDVFAFERALNGDRVVVVVNRGDRPYSASGLLPRGTENTRVGAVDASYWVLTQ
ncbi:MAG: alpha-amylase family glycosyl hydrolase [Planctomycetota bacterium]